MISAERALIGCILIDSHAGEIFAEMSAQDFIDPDCRSLFAALERRWREFGAVDAACVPKDYMTLAR